MSNNKKEINRDVDGLPGKLPSRMEVHGQKGRKGKKKSNDGDEQTKQKKIRLSIPLILLVILLLLPGTYAVYLFNKEKNPGSSSANGVGEEISYEEDNSVEISVDHKDSSNTPVIEDEKKDEKKQEQEKEKEKETIKKEQENDKVKTEEKDTEQKTEVSKETVNQPEQNEKTEEKVEEAKIIYHTVQKGETLFRISMQYYKSQAGIEKIKEANGITNNEIVVGQSLKIPLP